MPLRIYSRRNHMSQKLRNFWNVFIIFRRGRLCSLKGTPVPWHNGQSKSGRKPTIMSKSNDMRTAQLVFEWVSRFLSGLWWWVTLCPSLLVQIVVVVRCSTPSVLLPKLSRERVADVHAAAVHCRRTGVQTVSHVGECGAVTASSQPRRSHADA